MTKDDFYRAKGVNSVEWWVENCGAGKVNWARMRVFDDGSSDVYWGNGSSLYGFESRDAAEFFLAEDEHCRFVNLDEEDERDWGIKLGELLPPSWIDEPDAKFKYLGKYYE